MRWDRDLADTSVESKPRSFSDDDRIASAIGAKRLIIAASSYSHTLRYEQTILCRGWFALLLLLLLLVVAAAAAAAELAVVPDAALAAAWPGRGGPAPELDLVLDAVMADARKLRQGWDGVLDAARRNNIPLEKYSTKIKYLGRESVSTTLKFG